MLNSFCSTSYYNLFAYVPVFQDGMTALMYAAYKGKLTAVEHLLQNGADPNIDSTKDQVSHN